MKYTFLIIFIATIMSIFLYAIFNICLWESFKEGYDPRRSLVLLVHIVGVVLYPFYAIMNYMED
jgi:hypothetical protein